MSKEHSRRHRHHEESGPGTIGSVSDFAHQLTQARVRAGLTVRDVARVVRIAPSTAGDYFSGRHLPPVRAAKLLTDILLACGVDDPHALEHWHEALVRLRTTPGRPRADAPVPYRGLRAFEEEQTEWFFGRDELTATLVERLRVLARSGGGLLAVVGPSGSGKSSLLRAGLIPAVRRGALGGDAEAGGSARPVVLMTPGNHPAYELTTLLQAVGDPAPLIVVDQFEGLFTMCPQPAERARFMELLGRRRPGLVVIGLRADFYAQALRFPLLAQALQSRQLVVGPLAQEEMRQAIVGPARKAGLEVESGLVELLLRDLTPLSSPGDGTDRGGAAHDPGALPLLSHALLATWQGAPSGRLTVAAYRGSGGIRDAVAHTAETVFAELSHAQRDIARQVFLRLVNVSDDALTTRRRVHLAELLDPDGPQAGEPTAVLAAYVEQRLITADNDTVEISHESLLTAWPRLREWIGADHAGLRIHRRLTEAAHHWTDAARDPGLLLRGTALDLTGEWAADAAHSDAVNADERAFLEASLRHQEQERRAARNRTRRLYQLLSAAVVLLLVTCGLSLYAQRERDRADRSRAEAESRQLASEAARIGQHDPAVSAQLALAAYRTARTQEARAGLMDSSASPSATRLTGFTGLVQAVAFDSARTLLAAGSSDGSVRLWSTADRTRPRPLARLRISDELAVFAVTLSPDGNTLVAGGGKGLLHRWDVSDPRRPHPLPDLPGSPDATVYALVFAPDGNGLAAAGSDHTVRLWANARTTGTAGTPVVYRGTDYQQSVAFSPDGSLIAAAGRDGSARLWRTQGSKRTVPLATLGKFEGPALGVAFSPDGRFLSVCSQDRTIRLWDISEAARPRRSASPEDKTDGWVNALAFSPDGAMLATGGSDDAVRLWDRAAGYNAATLPHPGAVTSVAWFDQRTLVTGCSDGVIRLWSLPSPVLASAQGVNALAYSPDSRLMAVGTLDLQLWDLTRHERVGRPWTPGGDTFVQSVTFSPRGRILAVGYSDGLVRLFSYTLTGELTARGKPFRVASSGTVESLVFNAKGTVLASGADDATVRLWDTGRPDRVRAMRTLTGATDAVLSVAFTPDGRHIAGGSIDRAVRVWNVSGKTTAPLVTLHGPTGYVWSVAFSPDGSTLAAGSADRSVRLWDVRTIRRPVRVGPELTGFTSYVYSVAFSPDGRTLAAGSTDTTVWLFDVSDPRAPDLNAVLTAATGHVYAVAFSPDGTRLAAGGEDHTVRLWDTDADATADRLCETRGDPLTASEWRRFLPSVPEVSTCR
ncbi:WD40 repeat protein/transcriptional regulator with XRE-family HTH domain [Streptomyces aurantiacus]|uniref:nSTAND1 domain-containing NTPase n=1 Tax=Streptomyces aurantiacus TaxID=47760 RepID=UPI0027948510|nr:helix-turn-helix domain-containing protein [Streptomyces aurantiacus]MDQ0773934.1 WD40 repeat protein/transcriptional regulator with XRE-family HTH domain [Streptomyces aurantiacus]